MPSINHLLDEVIASVFAALPLEERHKSAPLVCRRWEHLCNSAPQLLRCIGFSVPGSEHGARRLSGFCAWLLQHGVGRVQRLSFEVWLPEDTAPAAVVQQLSMPLVAAVSACGAAGSLRALRLHGLLAQPSMWVHAMRSLQQLDLSVKGMLEEEWHPAPSALASLGELSLRGVGVTAQAPLPASLTKLHLDLDGHPENIPLPAKLSTLTRLHTLSLEFAFSDQGLSALASLKTNLRRLALLHCAEWPACLSELTLLNSLILEDGNFFLRDPQASAAAAAWSDWLLPTSW
ncbi:hypothetical protein ABPG75_003534 [Micractinium tetrahymenae]